MNCNICNILLDDNNWLLSRKKRNNNICKYCVRKDNNKRYQNKKHQYLFNIKNKYQNIKRQVFDMYGGKCKICNCNDYQLLSLDHINKNGRKDRKSVLKNDSGSAFYRYVLKHKPDNLRLLCFNCNCQHSMEKYNLVVNNQDYLINKLCKYCYSIQNKKYICNNCHQKLKHNYQVDLKLQAYQSYDNACANCKNNTLSFLTIDHINNDGYQHRKNIYNIYSWLRNNNYPKDNYQLLCFNCNYLKYFLFLSF